MSNLMAHCGIGLNLKGHREDAIAVALAEEAGFEYPEETG